MRYSSFDDYFGLIQEHFDELKITDIEEAKKTIDNFLINYHKYINIDEFNI